MTYEQIAIFALLAAMMVGFAQSRFRFEVVALAGLALAAIIGLVPTETLFSGFSSPTVITVIEILLIVQVLKRSSLLEFVSDRLGPIATDQRLLTIALCTLGAVLSIVMNNIGALALMLPLTLSICDRYGIRPQGVLMPLSFATLMGGLCSVVGTPANLLGATAIEAARGTPFGFFELALVGLPVTLAGLAYLYFVIPRGRQSEPATRTETSHRTYISEMGVPAGSALIGETLDALSSHHGIAVHNVVREGRFVFGRGERTVSAGDILVVDAAAPLMEKLLRVGLIEPVDRLPSEAQRREAVILPESIYVGSTIADLVAFEALDIAVVAASVATGRIEGRFADVRLSVGDVLVLEGDARAIAAECRESGLLELATSTTDGPENPKVLPVVVFGLGIASAALLGTPPEIAFGLVILVLALLGQLSLRQGLEDINWPILLLLGAMIPLGNAVAETGAANAVALLVAQAIPQASALSLAAAMLAMAIVLTPFVNNPTTVLVLAPVGVAFADAYGVPATPALVAITVGASLDFLTPFGHHNNTLVMGIAGYRFTDFFKLGWPLILIASAVSMGAIAIFYS